MSAIAGSLVFLLVVLGTVAVLVPLMISIRQIHAPLLHVEAFRAVGILLLVTAAPLLLDSFARFALQGRGTPVPLAPPVNLVVTGFYRRVRNPMYIGVLVTIVGMGLQLGEARIFAYAVFVALMFATFVRVYEEPRLRRTFGAQYDLFCANVPRWVPRLRPWRGGEAHGSNAR